MSQAAKAALSRRHSKVLLASLEVNSKLGVSSLLGSVGLTVIVVSGGVVSMVQV